MDEFISQCFLFFIAGYDTTATSLSMAAYCLAMNQEAQDKLYEETKEAFAPSRAPFESHRHAGKRPARAPFHAHGEARSVLYALQILAPVVRLAWLLEA